MTSHKLYQRHASRRFDDLTTPRLCCRAESFVLNLDVEDVGYTLVVGAPGAGMSTFAERLALTARATALAESPFPSQLESST